MKKKELIEFKSKSPEELRKILNELQERKETLRFDLAQGKIKNVRELRNIKKSIAQIMTILSDFSKNKIHQ
jgi:large subunit ribosomal protein L29